MPSSRSVTREASCETKTLRISLCSSDNLPTCEGQGEHSVRGRSGNLWRTRTLEWGCGRDEAPRSSETCGNEGFVRNRKSMPRTGQQSDEKRHTGRRQGRRAADGGRSHGPACHLRVRRHRHGRHSHHSTVPSETRRGRDWCSCGACERAGRPCRLPDNRGGDCGLLLRRSACDRGSGSHRRSPSRSLCGGVRGCDYVRGRVRAQTRGRRRGVCARPRRQRRRPAPGCASRASSENAWSCCARAPVVSMSRCERLRVEGADPARSERLSPALESCWGALQGVSSSSYGSSVALTSLMAAAWRVVEANERAERLE